MSEADNLKKAHAQLVEQRRVTIEALAEGKRDPTQIDLLLKIQSAIEVLDSLMAEDEDEADEDD
jgi:hypothetical protein